MTPRQLFEKMCDEASSHTVQGYPSTKQLFALIMKNFKLASLAITDIQRWIECNQYVTEQEWSIDMILLGYYMRTQYSTCWDTEKEEWVEIGIKTDEELDQAVEEAEKRVLMMRIIGDSI